MGRQSKRQRSDDDSLLLSNALDQAHTSTPRQNAASTSAIAAIVRGVNNGIRSKCEKFNRLYTEYVSTPSPLLMKKISRVYDEIQQYDDTVLTKLNAFRGLYSLDDIRASFNTYFEYKAKLDISDIETLYDELQEELENGQPERHIETRTSPPPTDFNASLISDTMANTQPSVIHHSIPPMPNISSLTLTSPHRSHIGLKYGNVNITPFDGDYLLYSKFLQSFTAHVDSNPSLSDLHKFTVLRQFLTGRALATISDIAETGETYRQALAILARHYDKPYRRSQALIAKAFSTQPLGNTPAHYQDYFVTMENSCTSLYDATDNPLNLWMRHMLFIHIPQRYKQHLKEVEARKEKLFTIPELIKMIRTALECDTGTEVDDLPMDEYDPTSQPSRTQVYAAVLPQKKYQRTSYDRYPKTRRQRPPHSLHTTRNKETCIFCGEAHLPKDCTTHTTVAAKRTALMNMRSQPCWICFETTHRSRECTATPCNICGGDHIAFLCRSLIAESTPKAVTMTSLTSTNPYIVLPITTVTVSSNKEQHIALLDSGSQRSLITHTLARSLKLTPLRKTTMDLEGILGTVNTITSEIYELPICLSSGKDYILQCWALPRLVGTLYVSKCSQEDNVMIKKLYPQLAPPLTGPASPSIVIGVDHVWDLWGPQPITLPSGLRLLHTELGLAVTGMGKERHTSLVTSNTPSPIDEDITSTQTLDQWAVEQFKNTVQQTSEGRISVSFPFHTPPTALRSDNYRVAMARLRQLFNKMKNSDKWNKYTRTIQEKLDAGILEIAPPIPESQPAYHIPHSAVMKLSSNTTKLRVVLDASSHEFQSPSLNDLLLIGPCDLPELRCLHLKFRLSPIAIMADIEKAFHQVEINEEHRDFTRLLWLKDTNKPPTQTNVITLRHTRLPFGVVPSPFLLSAALQHHIRKSQSRFSDEILDNIYVDNLLLTRSDAQDCSQDLSEIIRLFEEIGMNLREFVSNSPTALSTLPTDKHNNAASVSALGLKWEPQQDIIHMQTPTQIPPYVLTRREAISILASFYDPLGMLAPLLLHLCLAMNVTWPDATLYDLQVSQDAGREWATLATQTKTAVDQLQVERAVLPPASLTSNNSLELEVFSDASALAMGMCAYLKDNTTSNLLTAKHLMAPKATIPRLELNAAVLAMELTVQYIKTIQPHIRAITFYTDSTTVLQWMYSDSIPQQRYVFNRLKKMRLMYMQLSEHVTVQFRHIEGKHNPADVASRGSSPDEFLNLPNWWSLKSERPSSLDITKITPFAAVQYATLATTMSHNENNHSYHRKFIRSYRAIAVIMTLLAKRLTSENLKNKLSQAYPFITQHLTVSEKADILAVHMHQRQERQRSPPIWQGLDTCIDQWGLTCLKGRFHHSNPNP